MIQNVGVHECSSIVCVIHRLHNSFRKTVSVVCRNGLNTTMGSMVRELISPVKGETEPDPFLAVSQVATACMYSTSADANHAIG